MTRTIRMALAGNTVTGVDISPPFEDKPDRVPLGPGDKRNVVDPVGAVILPAPASGPILSPAACNRTVPIFDGYTRFDINLSYVGERTVSAKGYDGPVVVCAARYVPISGHSRDRPATKFMADNKDLEVWLAPIASDQRADSVPRLGAHDDRHDGGRGAGIPHRREVADARKYDRRRVRER